MVATGTDAGCTGPPPGMRGPLVVARLAESADARASIRLGWGRYTTEGELRDGLNAIKDAARLQGVN